MILNNLTELKIQFYKIAKKHEISMSFSSEKLIEIHEIDKNKVRLFVNEIKKISPETKVTDLIANNQYTDTKGNSILNAKSLYLVDDDYYRKLIGEDDKTNKDYIKDLEIMSKSQISMFG